MTITNTPITVVVVVVKSAIRTASDKPIRRHMHIKKNTRVRYVDIRENVLSAYFFLSDLF